MKRSITIFLIVGVAAILLAAYFVFGSATEDYESDRVVDISPGSNFSSVTDSLVARGILAAETRFRVLAKITGWDREMKAGHYVIRSGVSTLELLSMLRDGRQSPLRVTVPPGTRPDVFAAVVQKSIAVDSASIRTALRDDSLAARLETDVAHLFGFMLPETIEFFWGSSAEQVVTRLKGAFDDFFDEEMEAKAAALNLTKEEVVTLASIVEWEARLDAERPTIAGVYLNRIRKRMPLQADPTVQFAIMQLQGGRMRRLVFADYKLDHPYNTYLFYGLPPGPITNPSPASIEAVLNAEDHDYLFFVADGDGGHIFSRTLREHNNAATSYREMMRERRRELADSE